MRRVLQAGATGSQVIIHTLLLTHALSAHRCSVCLTKIWCSKECLLLNKEKHKEFCKEGVDARKVKDDAKIRKESGMEELEQSFAKMAKVECGVNPESFGDVKKSCQTKGKGSKSKVTKKN